MIKGLRKKFVLINMLLVFLVLATVFTVTAVTGYHRAVDESRMALQMALGRREGQRPPMFEVGQKPPDALSRAPVFVVRLGEGNHAEIVLADNIYVSETELMAILAEIPAQDANGGILRNYNLRWMMYRDYGEVRIAFVDRTVEAAAIRDAVLTSGLSLAGELLGFLLIGVFLSRWALRPVEKAWEQQKRFVADASHELKTPLTVILANAGILLENRADTVENQLKWVENTAAEAGRMKKLVDDMLFLAKSDDAKAPLVLSHLNLSDLVYSMALAFESLAYEKGITIQTEGITPEVYMQGDENSIKQLTSILLENALKYATPGSTVTIVVGLQQTRPVLEVSNMGKVLSAEETAHIFDRFYRADAARAGEGHGLGLAIAKSIVLTHQGRISARSTEETGTSFCAKF